MNSARGSRSWRWVAASAPGTSHIATQVPCQDAFGACLTGEGALILVAADGAGSAARAEEGARTACEVTVDLLEATLTVGGVPRFSREDAVACLDCVVEILRARAETAGVPLRDYACTLLVAVAGWGGAVFFQIGDGAIVVRDASGCRPVFWPETGEYANTTYFITGANAARHLRFYAGATPVRDLAVLTDGLQMLALQFSDQTVHEPFFDPMFDRLRREPPGMSAGLSAQLEAFLGSAAVNARTDDDKTLLLATSPGTGRKAPAVGNATP